MVAALRSHALAAAQWPARALHAAYLRFQIRAAERDLQWMQHQIDHASLLPGQMAVHRDYIASLRVQLIGLR